eukprot:700767-Prorocentrum_minimum.AAC.1
MEKIRESSSSGAFECVKFNLPAPESVSPARESTSSGWLSVRFPWHPASAAVGWVYNAHVEAYRLAI